MREFVSHIQDNHGISSSPLRQLSPPFCFDGGEICLVKSSFRSVTPPLPPVTLVALALSIIFFSSLCLWQHFLVSSCKAEPPPLLMLPFLYLEVCTPREGHSTSVPFLLLSARFSHVGTWDFKLHEKQLYSLMHNLVMNTSCVNLWLSGW